VYNTYSAQWSEGVEFTCKHAELTSPNDEALQKVLKKRKQKLSSINEDFSKRAETNLDMVKNLNCDSFRIYETKKGRVSMKVDENEKVSV
jgi:hypothetical protein